MSVFARQEAATTTRGGRGSSSASAIVSAISATAKAALAEASASVTGQKGAAASATPSAGTMTKAARKAALKAIIERAIFYTWYVTAGVVAACMCTYAYTLIKSYYYRRRVAAARRAGVAPTPASAGSSKSALSRAVSALHVLGANIAYVRVFPVWLFARSTAAEWFWTIAYTGICLGLGFWGCFFQGKLDYANPMGYVAFGQIPLIIGLSNRNNLISWLTGISYEKMNYLHRASGRVCVLTTWLHTLGWFHKGLGKHGPGSDIFLSGMLGAVALLIMWLTSFALARRIMYEAFLLIHILMCFVFVIAAYYHWPRLGHWCYAGLVIWGWDRGLGFLRMIVVNKAWLFPFSSRRAEHSGSIVELLSDDVVRLTVTRPLFRWSPGQHAFVTMPQIAALRYEQHPLTVANIPGKDGKAVFIIRAQTGFTRRLVKHLKDTVDDSWNCYLDGPYGSQAHLNHYDSVLLVAGGTGITYATSHLLDIIKHARAGTSAVSTVRLVWNVRSASHMAWIAPLLNDALAHGAGSLAIAIDVYITRSLASAEPRAPIPAAAADPIALAEGEGSGATTPTNVSSENLEKGRSLASQDEKHAMVAGLSAAVAQVTAWHHGRSPIEQILRSDTEKATRDAAGVGVAVCGPTALTLDTRRAVCRVNTVGKVLAGQAPIEFHQETFGW